ncbi:hypothetical protein CAPTEDRAFT_226803 [Capitella teleta]|uniref:Profilin n=1 Tax=Capitella teleta TaxID=283909 RepID=N1PB57_CAPTE|nr:hypothetical protein CAPTEDRAFT_226803 [Capitella teleta]|eukprot:ELU18932.1 hypothetical protein CAPTEDRAFT_226803 [Capitella teleta]
MAEVGSEIDKGVAEPAPKKSSWFDSKLQALIAFVQSKKDHSVVNTTGEGEDQGDMGTCCSAQKQSNELSAKYSWEQKTLRDNLTKFDKTVSHAAIVSYSDGELRAVSPETFRPNRQGIKDILNALKGDVTGLAENGINLGGGTNLCTPGKLEEGAAIFGADTDGGGCTVFVTKETALIVVYARDPAPTNRLAREVADYMVENDK